MALLFLLLAGSGFAALTYEIVWYQMLQLAIGSTTISMAILLAAFMGGLCIGSIWLPRYKTALHPLKLFAYVEAGIALLGLVVLLLIPLLDWAYFAAPGLLMRAIVAALCLLPPAILMGASLPAAARWIESSAEGASWWGLLYGGNTLGAVLGCLVAGFVTLRLYNQITATAVAIVMNLLVAGGAWLLAARSPERITVAADDDPPVREPDPGRASILWTIGLSGMSALGAEVVWTRLLGMLLGSTTYAFSIILSVFLMGIGLGSLAGSRLGRSAHPRRTLGFAQILLCIAFAWTCLTISDSLPYWPINPFLVSSPWVTFQIDMARVLWAVLPPAILWGASFPLALAAIATQQKDSSIAVGSVYAANTVGAVTGALATSLLLIPWFGTHGAQRVLLLVTEAAAFTALVPYIQRKQAMAVGTALSGSLVLSMWLTMNIPAVPNELIAYGRQMPNMLRQSNIVDVHEGMNSSFAVAQWSGGQMYMNVNGHVEATTEVYDMALQRMIGHLPALLHPNPKQVLVIGFGSGVSAGVFTRYPGVEKITIAEIESEIPHAATRWFAVQNYQVELDPRTKIIPDDARHYLLATNDKFDIVASDPLDLFARSAGPLYTKEYYDAVKAHLNPGGFFSLYVPLYERDAATVQSQLATFFAAFPNATAWANTRDGQGYDMMLLGQAEPLKINLDDVKARMSRADYAQVVDSLAEVGFGSATSLFSIYAGRQADLGKWFGEAEIARDRNLRLMYQAGWGINSYQADAIYREIKRARRVPGDLFTGDPDAAGVILTRIATP